MIELRNYQEDHVDRLRAAIDRLLDQPPPKICILQSPTGSGKTVMMAEVMKRLTTCREDDKEIAFIWIAVHRLHDQSKEKLESHYRDTGPISCSYFGDLVDRQIHHREVLFFNWHSINQKDNIYIRDNENEFNLSSVVENTRDAGRKIILVIDESHHTASGAKSREVIEMISPDVTVEVSATPKISGHHHIESVDLTEVKNEGMIKKLIKVNPGLDTSGAGGNGWILDAALEKQKELRSAYHDARTRINPLVLVQIPNEGSANPMKDEIIGLAAARGITTGNGRLAIYLSNDKKNLDGVEDLDSKVDVLIFKQAITIGWDCPRASILVLFREWNDYRFSIQTVGRIMRMPETKHYGSELLDNAYVYTNIGQLEITEHMVADYISIYESKRRDDLYDGLDLPSVYVRRRHERTRLSAEFDRIFAEVARMESSGRPPLMKRINLTPEDVTHDIIIDAEIEDLDRAQMVEGKSVTLSSSESDIQDVFNGFIGNCTFGFAPVRSAERIKRSIYTLFEGTGISWHDVQKIVLVTRNKRHFIDSIRHAIDLYREQVAESVNRDVEHTEWGIPKVIEYTKRYDKKHYEKCVMSPMYITEQVENENDFMDFIDERDGVKWWFKNGDSEKKYFAIEYVDPEDGLSHAFYVDFIICMKNGWIGLFDTKSGITARDPKTRPKAEALARYIRDNRAMKLFGGIVVSQHGIWLCNSHETYDYSQNDLSDWDTLNLD
ncbi:MAG: DEAD/DEAH box helicase family protein [Nitrosopumilus sp.]|nr:DEAD/DEAH box helicase family protein [Nitrosopumilus sp.]